MKKGLLGAIAVALAFTIALPLKADVGFSFLPNLTVTNDPLPTDDGLTIDPASLNDFLNPNTQRIIQRAGMLPFVIADPDQVKELADLMKEYEKQSMESIVTSYMPKDPTESFQNSSMACLDLVNSLRFDFDMSFIMALFEYDFQALADQLLDQLQDSVMTQANSLTSSLWSKGGLAMQDIIGNGFNMEGISQLSQFFSSGNFDMSSIGSVLGGMSGMGDSFAGFGNTLQNLDFSGFADGSTGGFQQLFDSAANSGATFAMDKLNEQMQEEFSSFTRLTGGTIGGQSGTGSQP